jgi:uncharacterized membrane protein
MTIRPTRTTKSARRSRIALTLLGVLAILGITAYAVAAPKADFSVAASPASQTASQGHSVTYTVTVTRVNGFAGAVTLSAGSLPAGATASWKLSDGTASNVVPPNLNSATLTMNLASSSPTGTFHPAVTATSGNLSHTTTATLVVESAAQPNLSLTAMPVSQTVLQGDDTSYTVNVDRTGGFNGPVNLAVSGLPKNVTAAWSPSATVPGSSSSATLQVHADNNAKADNYDLTITGTGAIGSGMASRSAAVTLVVDKTKTFQVTGNLSGQLAPGRRLPLDLTLTNPYKFALRITNLAVAIEEGTTRVGCSGTQNFAVTPIPAGRYPITLPAGATKTLTQVGVVDADKPQVEMRNLAVNQDACKGATIELDYAGSAGK